MTDTTYLALSHGTSRGRETYGYNIVTLTDESTGLRTRCMGGGYDMVGTVLADWFTHNHQDRVLTLGARAHSTYVVGFGRVESQDRDSLYGLARVVNADNTITMSLDGACGENSVRRVMSAAGFDVRTTVNRKGHATGFIVTDTRA